MLSSYICWNEELKQIMFGRLFITILIVLMILAVGAQFLYYGFTHIMGTRTVVMVMHNGTQKTLISGPNAPRPDWVPIMPKALLANAGYWVPNPIERQSGQKSGTIDLMSFAPLEDIQYYYLSELKKLNFTTQGSPTGKFDQAFTDVLGVESTVYGYHEATKREFLATIFAPWGWPIASRSVQIKWSVRRKTKPIPQKVTN